MSLSGPSVTQGHKFDPQGLKCHPKAPSVPLRPKCPSQAQVSLSGPKCHSQAPSITPRPQVSLQGPNFDPAAVSPQRIMDSDSSGERGRRAYKEFFGAGRVGTQQILDTKRSRYPGIGRETSVKQRKKDCKLTLDHFLLDIQYFPQYYLGY